MHIGATLADCVCVCGTGGLLKNITKKGEKGKKLSLPLKKCTFCNLRTFSR